MPEFSNCANDFQRFQLYIPEYSKVSLFGTVLLQKSAYSEQRKKNTNFLKLRNEKVKKTLVKNGHLFFFIFLYMMVPLI